MLAVRCTLLRGVFEGTRSDDTHRAEWPPSWMRLFSALVAAADVSAAEEDALLERLEREDAPEIAASAALYPPERRGYVPTNAKGAKGSTTWPDRTNAERGWARAVPSRAAVTYIWPDLELDTRHAAVLAALCRRVAYVGRATSPALVELIEGAEGAAPEAGTEQLVPRARLAPGQRLHRSRSLRVAGAGSLAELRRVYRVKHEQRGAADPWQARDEAEYGIPVDDAPAGSGAAPYEALVVFRLEGRYLDGRLAPAAVSALRRTALERAESPVPALTAGPGGCAFFALPAVGHEHSDGHLLGLAVAVPTLPDDQLRVVARALRPNNEELLPVVAGPLGVLRLRRLAPLDAEGAAWGLQQRRWEGPSASWVSAMPALLGDPSEAGGAVAQVVADLQQAGLPDPVSVDFSDRPLLPGAVDLRRGDLRHGGAGRRPLHVRLELPAEVRGPLLLGALTAYGHGLMAPLSGGTG